MTLKPVPSGSTAVMARRAKIEDRDPRAGLDFFPTPPWATRALFAHAIDMEPERLRRQTCWDPCCGEGHMAFVLEEAFGRVHASDIYPHGYGEVGAFVSNAGLGLDDVASCPFPPDWFVMNPPFMLAHEMLERAIAEARVGVAMIMRTAFLESERRYEIFGRYRPHLVAQFAERVPMTQYVWDPDAGTATAYAWFLWLRDEIRPLRSNTLDFPMRIIPPGCARRLTRPGDVERWARPRTAAPLLEVLPGWATGDLP